MNCAKAKERLSAYYDDELSDELAAEMARHVEHCQDCSAELASFQQLSAALCGAATLRPAGDDWQRIAARLERESLAAEESSSLSASSHPSATTSTLDSGEAVRPSKLGGARTAAAAILALAAGLFLIVGLRARWGNVEHQPSPAVASAVDYQDVFRLFEDEPQLAMEKLSERYEGREVSADQAEAMLGYRPSIAAGLPSQTRLVSTRVLKLPQCKCAGGVCTCGPGECNCAACLCERPDGSKFLVFEQCKTQDVTFGDLPSVIARRESRDIQFVKSHDQLAASWVEDGRRLTAIGLRNEAEADSLISALGSAQTTRSHRG